MYRAVLNGKKTVHDAENLHSLITASSEFERRIAASQIESENKRMTILREWRNQVIDILATIEIGLDFEDVMVDWSH